MSKRKTLTVEPAALTAEQIAADRQSRVKRFTAKVESAMQEERCHIEASVKIHGANITTEIHLMSND